MSTDRLPTRAAALAVLEAWTASDALRKHMRAVEAAMRAYAPRYGGDPERWGLAGLLHDFDYERYPNDARSPTEEHPSTGVAYLRTLGYPEDVLRAILGHASFTGVPRDTDMARVLFAVDELAGLITAVALVKPGRSLAEVDVPSVRKKMKDKAFARGVNRADIVQGVEELGVDLDAHIRLVIDAMRAVAGDLGLAGAAGPPAAS